MIYPGQPDPGWGRCYLPFARKTGNRALYKIKEKEKWGIGVDFDQYVSVPEVSGILLTSCPKKVGNSVYNIVSQVEEDGFVWQNIYYRNLSTVDIEIAPFHDYNALIPDSIKNELNSIRTGIKNGDHPDRLVISNLTTIAFFSVDS